MAVLDITDLPAAIQSHELVELMVAGANAKAARVAPCLVDDDPAPSADQLAEARLVLVGALQRWVEAGSGALQSQQAGPFGQTIDTRQKVSWNLWPSEIEQLQQICADEDTSAGAFSIRPTSSWSAHMPWCSYMLGALYCSCGADLTDYEYPLYEGGVLTGDEY